MYNSIIKLCKVSVIKGIIIVDKKKCIIIETFRVYICSVCWYLCALQTSLYERAYNNFAREHVTIPRRRNGTGSWGKWERGCVKGNCLFIYGPTILCDSHNFRLSCAFSTQVIFAHWKSVPTPLSLSRWFCYIYHMMITYVRVVWTT